MGKKTYVTVKTLKRRFDAVAERFTAKYAILVGLERLGGYRDSSGLMVESAYSLHVDGLCFRVESVSHATAFLEGVVAGFEFQANRIDVGFVTRNEMVIYVDKVLGGRSGSEGRKDLSAPQEPDPAVKPSL